MATLFRHSHLLRRLCIKHFSHSHPLRPVDVKEEEELVCSGCELDLSGSAYKCSKSNCEFSLHKSCFELPGELEHNSHSQHLLTLLPSPPKHDNSQHLLTLLPSPPKHNSKFTCDACGDYGTAFTYHCLTCQFNLHVECAFLTNNIKHVDHDHPLTLFYSSSMGKGCTTFTCDACKKDVPQSHWIYYCPAIMAPI